MFERYNVKDPNIYQLEEDFHPGDAHQSKALLVKNELLAKLTVLLGLHKYILYHETAGLVTKREVSDYLKYSYRSNFKLNQRDIEPFECPKLLGDVFESLMGAIFIDGGMEEVIRVYRNLVGPFVVFIAKFGKILHKEPKEEFIWAAVAQKIKPQFRFSENAAPVMIDADYETDMFQADVIFNNGQVMCTGYGSNRKQAERNASVMGLNWIDAYKSTGNNLLSL